MGQLSSTPPVAANATAVQADAVAAGNTTLLDVLEAVKGWGVALLKQLDTRSRLALASSSTLYSQWAIDTAQQLTLSLLAHSRLSDRAWRGRLAAAKRALAARGPAEHETNSTSSSGNTNTGSATNSTISKAARGTKLVVRIPAPNPAALQSALSLPPGAGHAVTELEVRQYAFSCGPAPDWPQQMAETFPHLHTLHLADLCCALPTPTLVPQLRHLQVYVRINSTRNFTVARGTADSIRQWCATIAPLLPQLSSLSISQGPPWNSVIPWPAVIDRHSTSLTHFTAITHQGAQNVFVPLLLKHTPNLTHLTYEIADFSSDFSHHTWGVTHVTTCCESPGIDESVLTSLPRSPGRVSVGCLENSYINLACELESEQGLSSAAQKRLSGWQLRVPCVVDLHLPDVSSDSDLRGTEAALVQLSKVLPAGSTIVLHSEEPWPPRRALTCAAITAAGPTISHITVIHMSHGKDDEDMAMLVQHPPQHGHVAVQGQVSGAYAHVPWPWQSLRTSRSYLPDLLKLPDPSGGQFDIHLNSVVCLSYCVATWTPDMLTELERRLQHWTFVVNYQFMEIIVLASPGSHINEQPAELRQALQALRAMRWRNEWGTTRFRVSLRGWTMSPAVVRELSGLPTFHGHKATLVFWRCVWVPESSYQSLASTVPASYSTWELAVYHEPSRTFEVEHVAGICMGAQARGEGCERLSLCVQYLVGDITDEQRSHIEACIDQDGLGRWVGVEWDAKP